MKYNKEVGKLLLKIKDNCGKKPLIERSELLKSHKCPTCKCEFSEHEKYIYCPIVNDYICDICCRYEICNDYTLLNRVLGKEIFKNYAEVIMLCEICDHY